IVHRAEELPSAFRRMRKNHDQAVMVSSSAFMFVHRKALADLAAEHRIPVMYEVQNFLESGGVMSYGVNVAEMQRRAAGYVDISKHAGRVNDESILVRRDCCVTLQCASVVTNEVLLFYAPEGRAMFLGQ